MQCLLTPSWMLTTENAASSYGQPVLLSRPTRDVFGPADILQPYPSWGYMPAAEAVRRMARTAKLDDNAQALVNRFCARPDSSTV